MSRRRRGVWVVAGIAATAVLLCCGLGGAVALSGLFHQPSTPAVNLSGCGQKLRAYHDLPAVSGYNDAQRSRAYDIIKAGIKLKVPPRGWVIAVATALQESGLKVYANDNPLYPLVKAHSLALPHDAVGHDHDSVGLFQQRPKPPEGEGGWGTVKELMNPTISAEKFYRKLLSTSGWQHDPLTIAAQAVQGSAYPDAYAKWEGDATNLVNTLTGGAARTAADASGAQSVGTCAANGQIAASGWVQPVKAPISSGFGPRGGFFHAGVDLAGPRGTPIRAAAAGLVVTAECDPATRDCDHDGSIATEGCGWYVEIKHAGGVETRYCHMESRPSVQVGQTVAAGTVLGHEGMSGNADGPHLHFEVHLHNDLSINGAIDPVPFMQDKGAPLGRS
jgi:murein DD-endopeptidase MepM/ murein hydrolase activator NlpD